ncbi:Antagonist of MEN (Mitotic Exit Network) [Mortierella sp. GBA43]|nr:Antagonist of MEN (Mitotic Exit Network) [Mortierella sp. GBA43]
MPKQQSNTDSHRKAVANARQTGRGLLRGGVRPGRSSSVGSDSTHSSASDSSRSSSSSSSGGGKQRRSSVTSSIAGVSIHDDYRKNNSSNDNNNNKSSRTLPNHQEYRQCGIFTSSNNSDHNDIKRRLSFHKTVATEASSRRGSAFSTNSQETAVNLTGINLGDEQDGECEKEDDHGMDLDDDDDDELDSELDAYYDFNEDYDESGNEAGCRRHNSRIRGATETDDLQLELQRRHRRRQALSTRRCLRKASFLSDKTRANSSGSGGYETTTTTTTSPPPHLGPSERASPIHLPEILHLIFQFVMDLTPQEDYSQREIHSCMLVCKQWYLVGQKILWRDIRFKNPTKMELFVDLLKRTETVECLGIENRKQKSQGRKKRSSIMARAQQQDAAAVEHSIMSPLAMQRRIQERAATVMKIVLHKLKTIEDDDIMPLTSWFHNLQIIEFYICERLTDKIVHAVAENCPLLQQLLMPGCAKVTDSGISKIALHCPRMKHLDLRACSSVSDESLLLVAKHCPELWHLNVGRVSSATKITGKSIVEIAKNTNLNTLGLAGCAMTDDAVIEIARHSRSGLHRISLNSCTALTSASVWALMQLCPNLAVLEIKQCLLIADMATLYRFSTRRVLVELCPELNRRLSAYKLELATMNTLIQSSSSNATTQMADGSGLNSTEVPMPIL